MSIPDRYTREDASEEDKHTYATYKEICEKVSVAFKGMYIVIQRKENT